MSGASRGTGLLPLLAGLLALACGLLVAALGVTAFASPAGLPLAALGLALAGVAAGIGGAAFLALRLGSALRGLTREAEAIRRLDLDASAPVPGGAGERQRDREAGAAAQPVQLPGGGEVIEQLRAEPSGPVCGARAVVRDADDEALLVWGDGDGDLGGAGPCHDLRRQGVRGVVPVHLGALDGARSAGGAGQR